MVPSLTSDQVCAHLRRPQHIPNAQPLLVGVYPLHAYAYGYCRNAVLIEHVCVAASAADRGIRVKSIFSHSGKHLADQFAVRIMLITRIAGLDLSTAPKDSQARSKQCTI